MTTRNNVVRLPVPAPRPEELVKAIRRMVKEGKYSFAMSDDDEKIAGGALNVVEGLSVLKFGEIDGPIVAGESAGEWKCQLITSLELRSSYVAAETVVVRQERVIVLSAKWID